MSFSELVYGVLVPIVDRGVIPLLYALAFVFFLIGIARFFLSDNDEKRTLGRQFALWSIIGMVVLFGVWGIVRTLLTFLTRGV